MSDRNDSIIEQAAKRLADLQRAGVRLTPAAPASDPVKDAAASTPTPELAIRRLATVPPAQPAAAPVGLQPAAPVGLAAQPSAPLGLQPQAATPGRPAAEAANTLGGDTVFGIAPAGVAAAPGEGGGRSREVDIDRARLAVNGYISPDAPRSLLAEEFRVAKRPLLDYIHARAGIEGSRANLIMITSARPGEGKTFCAMNLALSVAMELDKRVLLVDADVTRPAVLERFGLQPSRGLLDVLTDPSLTLPEVLLRTNIEKLTLLPAGTAQLGATELLASPKMKKLVDELARRYPDRVIIFDAPPLMGATESRVLATLMGQVVMVVEAERTPQSIFEDAMRTLEQCPVVTTLLNKSRPPRTGTYSY